MEELVLGIDVGTSQIKVGIFDLSGKLIGTSTRKVGIQIPQPGWVEQNSEEWWTDIVGNIRSTFKKTGVKPTQVKALSISAQAPVVVPVNQKGHSLHPALIWMDNRAKGEARNLSASGIKCSASDRLPKIHWFMENRKSLFKKTYKFLDVLSYVIHKLTGNFITDPLSIGLSYSEGENGVVTYSSESTAGIPENLFPDVMKAGEVVGTVRPEAARRSRLSRRTEVVMGSVDAYIAQVGVNALEPGCVAEITGTSTCLFLSTPKAIQDTHNRLFSTPSLVPNLWVLGAALSTTGRAYQWFAENFAQKELLEVKEKSKALFKLLDQMASEVEPGSEGLIFLPYLVGERSPIWDPDARGTLIGLSLQHKKSHVARAILEGVAFAQNHNLKVMESLGAEIKEIRTCGGSATSPLWRQIKADVTGYDVLTPQVTNGALMGAAITAAVGIEQYENFIEAANNMVRIKSRQEPNEDRHMLYTKISRIYEKTYLGLRRVFKDLAIIDSVYKKPNT